MPRGRPRKPRPPKKRELSQGFLTKIAQEHQKAHKPDPVRSQRVVVSLGRPDPKTFQYRPATDTFGYGPKPSTRGKLSKVMRAQIQRQLDAEIKLGLPPSANSVDDFWRKKKDKTRLARNKRRRERRAAINLAKNDPRMRKAIRQAIPDTADNRRRYPWLYED